MRRLTALAVLLLATCPRFAWSHSTSTAGIHVFDWHSATVSRVVSSAYSWNNFGYTVFFRSDFGESVEVGERRCMKSQVLDVDVADAYAFDIHETVNLALLVDTEQSGEAVTVAYDAVGGPAQVVKSIVKQEGERFVTLEFELGRARFANRGDHGTDLMIHDVAPITVCDIEIERSFASPPEREHGWLDLTVRNEAGQPTAARMGLYDSFGRMPIPSQDAVLLREFDDRSYTFLLQAGTPWPHGNLFVFYVDGRYRARVPAGTYTLVASKGIEYRMTKEEIVVEPGATAEHSIALSRFLDQPAAGWYSGDVHIHSMRRDEKDSRSLLAQVRAEDVHVGNILKMGNVSGSHFPQLGWGKAGRATRDSYAIVSGQEDPRTLTLGHTIHLDLQEPVRFPEAYLSYHKVFEAVAQQGGVSGYAHGAGTLPGTVLGMTLEAVFDLLDFGEVMQSSSIGTDVWFTLLNLGYRICPAAGTDYPYHDHPGAVRTYVNTGSTYDIDAWFEGLDAGRTFVSNGPLLSFELNGRGIGSEVRAESGESLSFELSATMSPDLGRLERLELIRNGEVIATDTATTGGEILELTHDNEAEESGWYVARAHGPEIGGGRAIGAISAPIYLIVDGNERTWKRSLVPSLVERLVDALETVKGAQLAQVIDSEAWETIPVWQKQFERQLEEVRPRIEEAQRRLRALADEAAAADR